MKSQNKQVLEHLQSGKGISSFTAIKKYLITRLSARICDLRYQGHEVYGKMIEHNNKRYKVYYMQGSSFFEQWGKSW